MVKEKCIHAGHRERMYEKFCKSDLFNFPPHEVVELLLTFIFPRGDVNPIAHRLIDKYGSLYAILEADVLDLVQIDGINTRSAQKIHLFHKMINYFTEDKITHTITSITNISELCDYLEQLLRCKASEELYLIGLDNKNNIKSKLALKGDSINKVVIKKDEIIRFYISNKPALVFIAHNHPNGNALPSGQDFKSTESIKNIFKNLDIEFYDSLIVGEEGIYSMKDNCYIKNFNSINFEKLENIAEDLEYDVLKDDLI
ncbi:MAG: RadC family protein [Clostridia bacterium]|nr:RadC family protein [Clostridia bacterium]